MKTFLNAVWEVLTEIGRTRAAIAAARAGQFDIAKALMK
jgi:hypothetical protein